MASPSLSAGIGSSGASVFPTASVSQGPSGPVSPSGSAAEVAANTSESAEHLIGIDEVQRSLNRSRASVYRYTNTDPRNLNPSFNPRKLNPEYRSDQKEPLMFHPNEVARFARDVLRSSTNCAPRKQETNSRPISCEVPRRRRLSSHSHRVVVREVVAAVEAAVGCSVVECRSVPSAKMKRKD